MRSKILCLGSVLAVLVAAGIFYRFYTTRADYLLYQGREALAHGKMDQAIRYAELLEQRGYADHGHLLRGEVWVREGRLAPEASPAQRPFRLALGELARIRDAGPLAVDAMALGGECLVRLGEHRFAAEVLKTVVERQPDHKEAHRFLAAVYMDLNSTNDAIRHLQEWGRLDPSNGLPFRWIGLFYKDYYTTKFDEAIKAYREACRRDLQPALRAEVIHELAEALIDGPAEYGAALDALDTLTGSPESVARPQILTLRAKCLWNLGQSAEAIRVVESALRAEPEFPQALRLRGKMFLSDGRPQAALPLLETAVRIDAHDHVSRQYLMQAYKQLGDNARVQQHQQLLEETRGYEDRLTNLHEQAARNPWDGRIRVQIADLCLKLNRQAEADMWRRAASACTPDDAEKGTGTFSAWGRNH